MTELILLAIITWPIWLFVMYIIAVQVERGGHWKLLYWFAAITLAIDAFINITIVSIILQELPFKHSVFLGRSEITISDRLERLVFCDGIVGKISKFTAKQLNRFAPSGVHIRNYKG